MILVNKRYQCRAGRSKTFYHMIEPSNFVSRYFPILPVATENLKNRTWKRPPRDRKRSRGLERIEPICCADPMTLTNMYEQRHALISCKQLCSGLAGREEKKR